MYRICPIFIFTGRFGLRALCATSIEQVLPRMRTGTAGSTCCTIGANPWAQSPTKLLAGPHASQEACAFVAHASLPAAVDAAAAQNLMTASQYIRESIIAQLKVDSIDLAAELRRSGRVAGEGGLEQKGLEMSLAPNVADDLTDARFCRQSTLRKVRSGTPSDIECC